eukprot:4417441-Ditylum_brightwellii.AAC.1
MDEGMIQIPNVTPVYGEKIYGVPTGDDGYIAEALQSKAKKITGECSPIESRLLPRAATSSLAVLLDFYTEMPSTSG